MSDTVYIETTIVSYLAARPSEDVMVAAHQAVTRNWWDTKRVQFELYASELVVTEASLGDQAVAERRLSYLKDVRLLDITTNTRSLARALLDRAGLPSKAGADALHIAIAAINGMDYLLTWNCAHIANAQIRRKVERICIEMDIEPPTICTPEELLGATHASP